MEDSVNKTVHQDFPKILKEGIQNHKHEQLRHQPAAANSVIDCEVCQMALLLRQLSNGIRRQYVMWQFMFR